MQKGKRGGGTTQRGLSFFRDQKRRKNISPIHVIPKKRKNIALTMEICHILFLLLVFGAGEGSTKWQTSFFDFFFFLIYCIYFWRKKNKLIRCLFGGFARVVWCGVKWFTCFSQKQEKQVNHFTPHHRNVQWRTNQTLTYLGGEKGLLTREGPSNPLRKRSGLYFFLNEKKKKAVKNQEKQRKNKGKQGKTGKTGEPFHPASHKRAVCCISKTSDSNPKK